MENVGNLIISLHRNLQEIQASLDTTGGKPQTREQEILQNTIERAEAALRAQASELVHAARATGITSNSLAASLNANYREPRSSSQQRLPNYGELVAPSPPRLSQPAPPQDAGHRASSLDSRRRRPLQQPDHGVRDRAKTTNRQRLLPKVNRLDPLADPPALTEKDLDDGLYSLATRGFIPQAADMTPAMERGVPVILHKPSPLYDQAMRHERRDPAPANEMVNVKLDLSTLIRSSSAPDDPTGNGGYGAFSSQVRSSRQLPPLPRQQHFPGGSGENFHAQSSEQLLALPPPPEPMPGPAPAQAFGSFMTELLDSAGDGEAFGAEQAIAAALPPPGPSQAQIMAEAATRISALWKGYSKRREHAVKIVAHRAAKRIQSAWQTAVIRTATREELMRREEEERKLQVQLMYQLGQDWFQAKALRRIEVHVCSLSVAESRRSRVDSYQALQAAQIARIFRLADPKRDIIFVAPKVLHEDILDYYAKIMQFRGVKNPPGRFQVVVPENMNLTHNMSLSQALLCSPKALKRVKKLISNRTAIMVPEAVTHAEAKLSSVLRLPLLGASARNMSLLASKSNAKKLTQIAELPIGPWAVDIYDEDEFYTTLAGLVVKHPKVKTWVFKIDDERDSRGTAYIDLSKLKEVSSLRASAPVLGQHTGGGSSGSGSIGMAEDDEEPAIIGADATEVRAALHRFLPRRAVLCNRRVHGDFAGWLSEACRIGCVIQAVPDGMISQTSVHLQIAPDGGIDVMGTSEAMMSQPFVRAASWYPHTRGSFEVLQEVAHRMGRVLAAKGLVGFASVDVVFFDNPGFDAGQLAQANREPSPAIIGSDTPVNREDLMFGNLRSPSPDMSEGGDVRPHSSASGTRLPESRQADYEMAVHIHEEQMQQGNRSLDPVSMILGGGESRQVGASSASPFACWVVDVDARLTDEAVALFPLQFVAQVKVDPASGFLQLTPEAPRPEEDAAKGTGNLTEEERFLRLQRWALVSNVAMAPQLEKMSYQTLFQAAKMRGVSFDLFHNVGCVFTFLDVVHKLFSLLAVEKSPETCAKRMYAAIGALSEGPPPQGRAGAAARQSAKVVAAPRDAPAPLGREDEASDTLSIADVQMALRASLKRWADKK